MKSELDEKLCADFPLLYRDRHGSMQNTCMCWGLDVGDGWYDIIYRLSQKLEAMIAKCPDDPDFGRPCASQVKEKFGGLRFYMTESTDEMEAAIRFAEGEASAICELCGEPGELGGKGWLSCRCEKCRA